MGGTITSICEECNADPSSGCWAVLSRDRGNAQRSALAEWFQSFEPSLLGWSLFDAAAPPFVPLVGIESGRGRITGEEVDSIAECEPPVGERGIAPSLCRSSITLLPPPGRRKMSSIFRDSLLSLRDMFLYPVLPRPPPGRGTCWV